MGAATFDSQWLKIWRGTRQLWGKNAETVQKKRVWVIRYELLKFFPLQVPVREFDICNDFSEGLHGVRLIECSGYEESTVFTNLIFSLFAVISYGKNILQKHLVRKCKKNIKYMNKKVEKVYSICKGRFSSQKYPQKYKNPNKIITCKVWDFMLDIEEM